MLWKMRSKFLRRRSEAEPVAAVDTYSLLRRSWAPLSSEAVRRHGIIVVMPELSRFFGIIIRMFVEVGEPHHRPHFHAYYQDDAAVFSIEGIEGIEGIDVIAGSLPRRQERLVLAWAEIHQAELAAALGNAPGGQGTREDRATRIEALMRHEIHRVVGFTQVGEFVLDVEFADGTRQEIDFSPVLHGELYGALTDPKVFAQVRLNEEVHTLVWPNGADFDPATLHDWPTLGPAMAELAARWATVASG